MQLSSLLCDSTSQPVELIVTLLLALGGNAKALAQALQIDQMFVSDTPEHILGLPAFKKQQKTRHLHAFYNVWGCTVG